MHSQPPWPGVCQVHSGSILLSQRCRIGCSSYTIWLGDDVATVTIRNLDGDAYQRLKARAKRNRRSVTQEAALLIEQALAEPATSDSAWRQVDRVREGVRAQYGPFPDSTPSVREDRER